MRSVVFLTGVAAAVATNLETPAVNHLFDFEAGSEEAKKADAAFQQVMGKLLSDWEAHGEDGLNHWLAQIQEGSKSFLESKAANAYKTIPNQPICSVGPAPSGAESAIAAYPGGASSKVFGFDLVKLVNGLAARADGPAAASAGIPAIMGMQALSSGSNLVKSLVSAVLQVVPPLIPPPIWINQPLPCLPMVTGHNCFGAVLYPITAADSIMADVTDSQLDGTIVGFPGLYANKVGKTSDAAYKACFSAYMSLQCASIFPMCTTPMAHDHPGQSGRAPLCFFHCIAPLVLCPGFWIEDIGGECQMASVPPMCSVAVFLNYNLLPPQYTSFEESVSGPMECPQVPASLAGLDASHDYDLYSPISVGGSAYSGAARLPVA